MPNFIESVFGFDVLGMGYLFGEAPDIRPDWRTVAVNTAVTKLRKAGHSVRPAEGVVPGLWDVSGHPELTTGQLLDLAAQLPG